MNQETVLRNIDRLGGRHDEDHWGSPCVMCGAHDAAAHAFAHLNGWKLKAGAPFNLSHIGLSIHARLVPDYGRHRQDRRLLDHPLWFTAARRCVAAVGQPYDWEDDEIEECRAHLSGLGLALHIPPDPFASIHYPGNTLFLVVTQPGVDVRWLPEQAGGIVWKG